MTTGRVVRRTLLIGALAAFSGVGALSSPLRAHAVTPACSFAFYDASSDANDNSNGVTSGPHQANLDIVEGDLGLTADGQSLRTVLTLENQNFAFAQTGPAIDYQMVFQFGSTQAGPSLWATDASLVKNPNGPPTEEFTFGAFKGVSVNQAGLFTTQYAILNVVTGTFGSGAGATVEVDVPLSDITAAGSAAPKLGDVLSNTQGYSASGQGTQGAGNEFISDQDPTASASSSPNGVNGNSYTVGQQTCVSAPFVQAPEAPFALLLALAGVAAVAAGSVQARRRHRRAAV